MSVTTMVGRMQPGHGHATGTEGEPNVHRLAAVYSLVPPRAPEPYIFVPRGCSWILYICRSLRWWDACSPDMGMLQVRQVSPTSIVSLLYILLFLLVLPNRIYSYQGVVVGYSTYVGHYDGGTHAARTWACYRYGRGVQRPSSRCCIFSCSSSCSRTVYIRTKGL